MINKQKLIETTGKQVEKAEAINKRVEIDSKTVTKLKQLIRNKKMSGNEQIKIQKVVLTQLAKDIRLNKISKLVSRLSKAVSNIT